MAARPGRTSSAALREVLDHYRGLGYEFALDQQTDLYAYYATVTNQNGGTNSLCAGGTCQGFDSGSGLPADFTPKSLMLGARYRF